MGEFVLMLAWAVNVSVGVANVAFESQAFNTKTACESAAKWARETARNRRYRDSIVGASCINKTTGEVFKQ